MRQRSTNALMAAAVCAGGLALTGVLALLVPIAQAHDNATLAGFVALSETRVSGFANVIVHSVDVSRYIVIYLVLVAIALLRRRPRVALVVALVMPVASASTELLKPLVATARFSDWLGGAGHVQAASWPSGHATAAMTVALCAVLVAPRRLRPLAALLGTMLAVGVSYSLLVLGWHFPSDVLGGFFVAGLWVSLGLAALWRAERRWPAHSGRAALVSATRSRLAPVALLALGAGGALVYARVSGLVVNASFAAGALAIAALAAALAASLAIALRT